MKAMEKQAGFGKIALFICFILLFGGVLSHAEETKNESEKKGVPSTKNNPLSPFGTDLFQGQFGADKRTGLNPQYRITPGDEIAVYIWGQVEFQGKLTVDNQGNIFLPKVGPVKVQGVHFAALTDHVRQALGSAYTDNVHIYTDLLGTHPISVFVTGAVNSPGRYSGFASYSVLNFIDMAQGIDPNLGTFRQIDILRKGEKLVSVDLYSFLLDGFLPQIQLHDGDTVLVNRQYPLVSVQGEVKNPASFEFKNIPASGREVLALAKPSAKATHVLVQGMRQGKPFSTYMPLKAFGGFSMQDGDLAFFQIGVPQNYQLINIDGQHKGPQAMVVPQNVTLIEILNNIPVDQELSDISSVYLKRKSVVLRQKQALQDSLQRLESSVLSTSAVSEEEARIQAQQVKMVQGFVERAAEVEPEGRMVVSVEGTLKDVFLEDGDVIVIPKKTDIVLINGEVLMPRGVVFQKSKRLQYYIDRAGGLTQRADDDRILVVRANGEAFSGSHTEIRPGDEIMVLPKVPTNFLQVTKDIAEILYRIAVSTSVILRI